MSLGYRDGDIIDSDVVFIRECMTYVRDDQGFTNAQEGMFDDTVMAKAINLKLADFSSLDAEYAKDHINKPIKRNKNATRNDNTLEPESYKGATKRKRISRHNNVVAKRRAARAAHRITRRAIS